MFRCASTPTRSELTQSHPNISSLVRSGIVTRDHVNKHSALYELGANIHAAFIGNTLGSGELIKGS